MQEDEDRLDAAHRATGAAGVEAGRLEGRALVTDMTRVLGPVIVPAVAAIRDPTVVADIRQVLAPMLALGRRFLENPTDAAVVARLTGVGRFLLEWYGNSPGLYEAALLGLSHLAPSPEVLLEGRALLAHIFERPSEPIAVAAPSIPTGPKRSA